MITVVIAENEEKVREMLSRRDESFSGKEGALYRSIIERIERLVIEQILELTGGNQLKAAKILGINRNTIRSKIKKLNIDPVKWKAR